MEVLVYNNYMANLYLLIGNIGSGKSTWTKANCEGKLVISRDDIRYMLGGGSYLFDWDLEPRIRGIEMYILLNLLSTGKDIIIDEIGISKEERTDYISTAKNLNYNVIAVQMPKFSKEICVDRRMKHQHRGYIKKTWEEVWDRFDKQYEPPTYEEGFWDIVEVTAHQKQNEVV